MIASSRPFRLMAASMAVLLFVSGSLPLVQHVCAMAARHTETDEHAAPHDHHGTAAEHQGMHDHGAMHGPAPMPAPAQAEPTCSHDRQRPAVPRDCCMVETTPGVVAPSVVAKRSLESVVVQAIVAAEALLLPEGSRSHTLFFDTGPPPASVSLHLLHAVLLN